MHSAAPCCHDELGEGDFELRPVVTSSLLFNMQVTKRTNTARECTIGKIEEAVAAPPTSALDIASNDFIAPRKPILH